MVPDFCISKEFFMTKRFPVLHTLAEISADLAFFALFIFFMLRPYIRDFFFLPLGAGLLLLRLFDAFLLREPRTAGFYTAANVLPGLLTAALSLFLLRLDPFHPAAFTGCAFSLGILTARAIYQAASVRRVFSPGLTADLLFLQCLAVSLWRQFSSLSGLESLWEITVTALVCTVADLAVSRLSIEGKSIRPGIPLFLGGILAALFALLAAKAASFGQAAAGGIAAVFLAAVSAVKALFRFVGNLFLSLWEQFSELVSGGGAADTVSPYETYAFSQEELKALEEKAANAHPEQLVILLVFFLTAALGILIFQLWQKRLFSRTVSMPVSVTEQRRSCRSRSPVRSVLQALHRFFSCFYLLLFRSGQISALLIRADWYGRRKLCPRRKGETVREYLLRLDERETGREKTNPDPVRLLAHYADQYLYSPCPPHPEPEEIRAIKKAFPLFGRYPQARDSGSLQLRHLSDGGRKKK